MKQSRGWLSVCLVVVFVAGTVPAVGQAAGRGPAVDLAAPAQVPAGLSAAAWQKIQSQVAKLTAADGALNDGLGGSVSVSGDTAVVGATGGDGGNVGQGAAYVFNRNQGGADAWGQVAKLTANDGAGGDAFGYSVSVDGDTAVVGALWAAVGGIALQGAAYVFNRNQGGADAWGQVAKISAADGAAEDLFGHSVSVSGDTAVVGAGFADVGGNLRQGAAYIFYRNQGGADAWGQVAKLTAADGAMEDSFGYSVSVSGDMAVAGAYLADIGGQTDQGAAYVFYRNQGGADAWGQAAKLTANDGAGGDAFGNSVSVSGDEAVVGAPYDDVGGIGWQGSAYVFYRNQGGADAWGQVAKLTANDGAASDAFGLSVSVSGDMAVAGAWKADVGGHRDQGAAYVFYRNQGGADAWGQVAKLTAADGALGDWFGRSVSVSGDTAVAGAPNADVGGNNDQGAAYVYALPSLHLNALKLAWTSGPQPGTYKVAAIVRVHDQDHAVAPGVTVYGDWTLPNGSVLHKTALTNAKGLAAFNLKVKQAGTYQFCVTDMSKAGYGYDPGSNEVPACNSIVVGP